MFERVECFVQDVGKANHAGDLAGLLDQACRDMGFDYFALTEHADPGLAGEPFIRVANYPDQWVDYFDRRQLGTSDPVHRASGLTSVGFSWSDLPTLIRLTGEDKKILELAGEQGIGNGFTVPAHVPGEVNGSCSFATRTGSGFPADGLHAAQLVGAFAFEAARRIWRVRPGLATQQARLTDRQRDCLLWAARGKSDWEISRILGVSHDTVTQHLKQARERYGVGKRTELTIRALFDGTLSFRDVIRR